MNSNAFKLLKFLLEANFGLSVLVLVGGSLLSVSGAYAIFEFNEDLYGALANNLRIMMIFLAMSEIAIFIFCYVMKSFHFEVVVGFFLILMIGSLEFYGKINQVDIDPNYTVFFLYTGLSHIVYGVMVGLERNHTLTHSG